MMDSNKKLSEAKFVVQLPAGYVKAKSKSASFLARINAAIGKETAAFITEQTGNLSNAKSLPH